MRIVTTLLLPALLASAAAQAQNRAAAARPCITAGEGEGLALYMMPEIVRGVSSTCKAHLPPTAMLASPTGLIAKFEVESDASWPAARTAFIKLAGNETAAFLDGDLAKPMLSAMMGPMVAAEVKPKDCAAINRAVELLQPLPARNTAALVVMLMQLGIRNDAEASAKLPLCPFVAAR